MCSSALASLSPIAHRVAGLHPYFAGIADLLPSRRDIGSVPYTSSTPAAGRRRHIAFHRSSAGEFPASTPYRGRRPEWLVIHDPAGRSRGRATLAPVASSLEPAAPTPPTRSHCLLEACTDTENCSPARPSSHPGWPAGITWRPA